jgi:hypothetical protein
MPLLAAQHGMLEQQVPLLQASLLGLLVMFARVLKVHVCKVATAVVCSRRLTCSSGKSSLTAATVKGSCCPASSMATTCANNTMCLPVGE